MKSTLFKNDFEWMKIDRHFIECSCHINNHLLIIDVNHEDKYIDFSFVSDWRSPLFKRIKESVLYILFDKPYNTSNTVMITKENIEDLEKAIEDIKKVL